jgi:hypothetical protein
MRNNIKNNIDKILNGEMTVVFVPSIRNWIKKGKLLGEPKCYECGIGEEWNGKSLILEMDHIDGDKHNNKRDNLRFLCPNCHSQTQTFRIKNYKAESSNKKVNSPSRKWVDEETLLNSIKQGGSIASILRRAGLKPVGDNYNRVHRLKIKYNIS